jgi:hypothetical protein
MIDELQYQIKNDLYEMYPETYEPVYRIKEKLNVLCGADYNTLVFSYKKIGTNKIIVINDNSFMGFCRDIFLNPSLNYFSYYKCSDYHVDEITFENIWKTINCYNHCKDMKQNPFQWINHKNFIEFKNLKCINSNNTTNDCCHHYPIPSFINKNDFIQGIKFGNSNCYEFFVEFKEVFCIIQCIGS